MDEFLKKIGLIVDFWIDDNMFVTHKKWKMWIQKNVIVILKQKIGHHKMNNLIVRCIEIFPI
jgi:hypothetical protein